MIAAQAAEALVARGLDADELVPTRDLFARVLASAGPLASANTWHAWWAPGRLEIFGKHTDYAGGRTLICAVPRGLALVARRRADDRITVVDARYGEEVTLSASGDAQRFSGWRHYVEVTVRRLSMNFPGAVGGADIVFGSSLPRASGMSSSSALVVALASALVRTNDIAGRPGWQANIHGALDAAGYFASIENGLSFGTLAGDAGVGTHGGSEDHAAIVAAEAARVSAYSFVPMRLIDSAPMPDEWRFAIAPCHVTAEKTGGAQDRYNRLAEGLRVLLALWNSHEPPAPSLAAALASGPFAVDRLRALAREAEVRNWPAEALEKRLEHFVREDARSIAALAAFRTGDARELGELADASQRDAETLLENQIPETIALARAARHLGAFAACSFGAGFGGSVWALVPRGEAEAFAKAWHPGAFLARPAPPLTELA